MSQRKLLQEIDKVFKKVKEGLDIFDGYYDKLQVCENQSQKEKLESDLKREIKKLQKQRDQIKSWLSGNEVKDKKNLLENRKNIENAMERFKIVEKNMKTKAFSREGLSQERNDPRQKEKEESCDFLQQMAEELERQNEKHEANIEQIYGSGKKSRKLDSAKQQEITDLQEKSERNLWHIEKLDQIQRLILNDMLDCEPVTELQDDIKYYVEENEDPDFLEDEALYDDLKLDEIEESFGSVAELAPKEEEPESVLIDNTPKKPVSSVQQPQLSPPPAPVPTSNSAPGPSQPKNNVKAASIPTAPAATTNIGGPTHFTSTGSTMYTTTLKPAVLQKQELKYASVVSAAVGGIHNGLSNGTTAATGTMISSVHNTPKTKPATLADVVSLEPSSTNLHSVGASPSGPPGLSNTPDVGTPTQQPASLAVPAKLGPIESSDVLSSLEFVKEYIQKPATYDDISKMLDISLLNCPDSYDAEKPRTYDPKNPHPTSLSYPQDPLPELAYSSIVSKLDMSTLFFNFYYNQEQYAQLLSARELVKKGWLYDADSHKWYQKTEEVQPPMLVNGQVVSPERTIAWKYFDYEGVWLSRRVEAFDAGNVRLRTTF